MDLMRVESSRFKTDRLINMRNNPRKKEKNKAEGEAFGVFEEEEEEEEEE